MSTFFKTCVRGIKGSLSRFLAILSIVALGTGFLSGLLATTPDMKDSSNKYFDDQVLYDFMIQSNLGLSKEDRKAVEKMPEIEEAVSLYEEDVFMHDEADDEKYETRLTLFPKDEEIKINQPLIKEGRLAKKTGEVFAVVPNPYAFEVKIGQVFKDDDGKEYEVVGKGDLPQFMSSHGETSRIGSGKVLLAFYGIDDETRDVHTVIYARGKDLPKDSFSEDYEKAVARTEDRLKDLGKKRSDIRRQEIVDEAQESLDEHKKEYEEKKKEAEDELSDAESKLKDGQDQIRKGWDQLNQAAKEVNEQIDQLNLEQEKLNDIAPKIAQLEEAAEEAKRYGMSLPAEKQAILQEYYSGRAKVDEARKKLAGAKKEIEDRRETLRREEEKIREGWAEYDTEKKKADDKLAEAKEKIDEAQEEVDGIKKAKWYVWNRSDNIGIDAYKSDVEKVGALAKIFPVFFFLVAVLVALTTMTRMIEEQRETIGSLKAIGYSNAKIRSYYLLYGLIAAIIGAVIGQAIGFYVFPMVISNTYSMIYNLPVINPIIIWKYAIPVTLVILGGILVTVSFATTSELKEVPASLLLPKAPPPGKRILLEKINFIWSRIKFSRKVTLRNLFLYKKRFLMTIIGVAGCYALLVAGFGIRDSIGNITNLQFDEINTYDITFRVKSSNWENQVEGLDKYTKTYQEQAKANSKKVSKRSELSIIVPKDLKEIQDFISIRERETGETIELDDGRVVIDEKLSESLDLSLGSKIRIYEDGREAELTVGGICENYVGHVVYMNEKTYREAFSKKPKYKRILALQDKDDDTSEKELLRRIKEDDDVDFVLAISSVRNTFAESVKSINYIVLVLIIAAGALAITVLYNLTNVNICERKKELATIKVLGFYDREAAGYIFREMHILTAIGIAVGMPTGIGLHKFIIKTVEVGEVMFGRSIAWPSFVYAILITIFFAAIVNAIMKRVIINIDMVESMKAND